MAGTMAHQAAVSEIGTLRQRVSGLEDECDGLRGLNRRLTDEIRELRAANDQFRSHGGTSGAGTAADHEVHGIHRYLVNLSPDAVVILQDARYQFVNPAFTELFGYSREEAIGDFDPFQLVPDNDKAEVRRRFEARLAGEEIPKTLRVDLVAKDGTMVPCETSGAMIQYRGRPADLVIIRDITERKKAEEGLRESEARLRAIMDNSPTAIFLKDTEGHYLLVNRRFEEWFDPTAGKTNGKTPYDLFSREDADFFTAADRMVLETGAVNQHETDIPLPGGGRLPVLAVKFPIQADDGKIIGIGGINVDITARKQAERALRESEARLRAIMENSPASMYLKDTEGRYLLVNRYMREWRNLSAGEWCGKTVFDFLPTEFSKPFAALDDQVRETGVPVEDELDIPHPDGTNHTLMVIKFPVRDTDSTFLGIGGFEFDITERRRSEEEVRRVQGRLHDAIESIRDGFALFDADDRLVLSNEKFRDLLPRAADVLRPGVEFETLLRTLAERGEFAGGPDNVEEFVRIRLERHRTPGDPFEHEHADDRWVQVNEYKTQDGGTALIRTDITEQKRAESALRESGERLRAIMDNSPAPIHLKDAEGRLLLVNERFEEWYGISPAQAVGRMAHEIFPGDSAENFASRAREAMATGATLEREVEIPLAGGTMRTAVAIEFPILGSDGKAVGTGGFEVDITERKRAGRALRENEALLGAVMENSPAAIYLKDTRGRYLLANSRFEEWYGVADGEVAGKTTHDIFPDETADRFIVEDRRVMQGVGLRQKEAERHSCDGRQHTVMVFKFPIRSLDGIVIGVGGINIDATEQERTERALRASEERFRNLVESTSDWVWEVDRDARYTYVSPKVRDILGHEPDEVLGRTPFDLMPSEEATTVAAEFGGIVETRKPFSGLENVNRHKNGSLVVLETSGVPIFADDGTFAGYRGIDRDTTRRKHAENALRESEGRLKAIMDNSPAAIHLKTPEGRYLTANKRFEEWNDTTLEKAQGRTVRDYASAGVADHYVALDRKVLETGTVQEREIEERFPDGITRATMVVKFPVTGPDGSTVAIGGMNLDITERTRVEKALHEREAQFRAVMDNSPIGVFMKDTEGRYLFVNNRWASWNTTTPEEARGKTIYDFRAKELADGHFAIDRMVMEGKETGEREIALAHPDGNVRTVLEIKFPIPDANGSIVGVGGTVLDITERQKAQKALRESEERLRAVMDNSPAIIYLKDAAGRYLLTNRGFEELNGVGGEEVKGKTVHHLFSRDVAERIEALDRDVVETGLASESEIEEVRSDGLPHTTFMVKFPVLDTDGAVAGSGGIEVDITERKNAEEALRRAHEELEIRVDERTLELREANRILQEEVTERERAQNEALRRQNELAHVSRLSTMGEMATSLAHELNQPLSAVSSYARGCARRLRMGKGEPAQLLEAMERVAVQAERAGEIIRRIRGFVRKETPKWTQVDVNLAVNEVADLLGSELREYGVGLELELTANLPAALGDPVQIQQVILNIVRNGIEAINESGVPMRILSVDTGVGDDGGTAVAIRDSGPGMSADTCERVFDPFFTTRADGLGMGLSISRSIVETHGGRIWVTSEGKAGSTFRFVLPPFKE